MRAGVSTESVSAAATIALVTGSADADYPLANVGDLAEPSQVARLTPAGGALAITAVLPGSPTIGIAALVAHTLPAGATVRARFYVDGAFATLQHDTGAVTIPNPVAGYTQTFPALMPEPLTIRSVRIDIAGAGSGPIDIGALEIGDWWQWGAITATADTGISEEGAETAFAGGGAAGPEDRGVRTYAGQVSRMAIAASLTAGLDFQKTQGLAAPFVFVKDADDATTWPRFCFLAVNAELPPFTAQLYDRDQFQFRLVEHVR